MTPEIPEEVTTLCLKLRAGHFDQDAILHIVKTLGAAVADGTTALRWVINLPDLGEVKWGQVKPSEAEKIERLLGLPWVGVHPGENWQHYNAIVRVLLETRLKLSPADVEAKLDELTVDQMVEAVDVYAGPPLKAAGQSD